MGNFEIDVLLASFNGEPFLQQQIDSILAQQGVSFRILARDDLSTDSTPNILSEYSARLGERFEIVESRTNLGPKGNFSELITLAQAPYIAFADQDDVWLPGKLQTELQVMKKLEAEFGEGIPLLVHSDLTVVAKDLTPVANSFWKFEGIDPSRNSPNRLLVQNTVTGCTILCNRRLLEVASPIPEPATMHDHWLALVAAVFGRIAVIPEPMVKYRRHASNSIGPKKYSPFKVLKAPLMKLLDGRPWRRGKWDHNSWTRQANAFREKFGAGIPVPWDRVFEDFSRMPEATWLQRRVILVSHGLWVKGVLRNLFTLVRI